ncbi:MAG: type II toxin-antitoxin system prevent-host-death family antitoxin [Verrucomicrobia bacterium]|nr:type II toxin-antitoxin system prevent-host-death family antitoxin [Verrucomicrobiota bacterium]
MAMGTRVNIYDAKARFSSLIATVERSGTRIVICRHGKPVADLTPHRGHKHGPLIPDPALAGACFHGDPCAPLSPADWPEDQR